MHNMAVHMQLTQCHVCMCHSVTTSHLEAVVMWHVTRPPALHQLAPGDQDQHWPQMTLHLPNITRHQTHFKPHHLYSSILIENGQLVSTLNIVQLWSWFEEHHQQCPLSTSHWEDLDTQLLYWILLPKILKYGLFYVDDLFRHVKCVRLM